MYIIKIDGQEERPVDGSETWLSVASDGTLQFTEINSASFVYIDKELYKIQGQYVPGKDLKPGINYKECILGVR